MPAGRLMVCLITLFVDVSRSPEIESCSEQSPSQKEVFSFALSSAFVLAPRLGIVATGSKNKNANTRNTNTDIIQTLLYTMRLASEVEMRSLMMEMMTILNVHSGKNDMHTNNSP